MVSISHALRRIKGNLDSLLSETYLAQLARDAGCRWRERRLTPAVTIQMFILQILHGNVCCAHAPRLGGNSTATQSGPSSHNSMPSSSHADSASRKPVSASGRPISSPSKPATASAYCQARMRLPLDLLRTLLRRIAERLQRSAGADGRWHGHRTFLLDGSSCSMPDTAALQREFGQPSGQKKGRGFPVAHLLALFDAHVGTLIDVIVSSWRAHDLTRANEMHAHLQSGDLLLADRGFCSYAHLALLSQQNIHVVFRMHQRQIVDFTPQRRPARSDADRGKPRSIWLAALGGQDQAVLWRRPPTRARWMAAEQHAALPEYLAVREMRYRVGRPGFRTQEVTLVTTLLDPETYPAEALAELYASRWQVEVNLRHLKETLGMRVLHSKTVDGVRKELLVFALVYNLVRAVMHEAATHAGVEPDRVSFIDAWRWLRDPWDEPREAGDESRESENKPRGAENETRGAENETRETWDEPYDGRNRPGDASSETSRTNAQPPPVIINPLRPGRYEPRVRKRRPPEYSLMTRPRAELRKALLDQSFAA